MTTNDRFHFYVFFLFEEFVYFLCCRPKAQRQPIITIEPIPCPLVILGTLPLGIHRVSHHTHTGRKDLIVTQPLTATLKLLPLPLLQPLAMVNLHPPSVSFQAQLPKLRRRATPLPRCSASLVCSTRAWMSTSSPQ